MPGTSIKDALAKWETKTGQKAAEATCIQLNMLVPPIDKMDSSLNNLGACAFCQELTSHTHTKSNRLLNWLSDVTSFLFDTKPRDNNLWNYTTSTKLQSLRNLKVVFIWSIVFEVIIVLEWLSLSTNCIEKISNLNALKHLKILSLGRNNIKNLTGLEAVADSLEQLWISYNLIEKLKGITVLKKMKILYMSNNNVKEWGEFGKLNELSSLEELSFVGNPLHEKHEAEGDWRQQVEGKLPRLKKLDGLTIVKQDEEED